MKKLDKLILSSFIGPFIITFLVVVFILLNVKMLNYFDDIFGKDLGGDVIGQLLFYFAIFMTPIAMPLAVLLSSLIAFGNLGEHFELTAVKSAGISLVRTLLPIFIFVLGLTAIAFYVNNNLVPKAALEAYSLLYDIKQKKPALDLREGAFYDGIPNMNIRVNKKFPDGITLKDIIIYDHRKQDGNKDVTIADSGKMYTIMNEQYLKLELFDGYKYSEGSSSEQEMSGRKRNTRNETLSRSKFAKTQVVFDLSSFALERTDKKWFQGNRIMRNLAELDSDIDSLDIKVKDETLTYYINHQNFFSYYNRRDSLILPLELYAYKLKRDSIVSSQYMTPYADSASFTQQIKPVAVDVDDSARVDTIQRVALADPPIQDKPLIRARKEGTRRSTRLKESISKDVSKMDTPVETAKRKPVNLDSIFNIPVTKTILDNAANKARSAKSQLVGSRTNIEDYLTDRRVFMIQWHKILASSMACIAMFLIGAPLGAIIKKGGLGVPFLVSILFFIVYYLLTMTGEKWAKQGTISVQAGVWAADAILLVIGLIFLRQARLDARLFEADFYNVVFDKFRKWLRKRGILAEAT